jgi:hypothetical protein
MLTSRPWPLPRAASHGRPGGAGSRFIGPVRLWHKTARCPVPKQQGPGTIGAMNLARALGTACLPVLTHQPATITLSAQTRGPIAATLTVTADSLIASFRPDRAWGAALDGQDEGEIGDRYTAGNLAEMNSTGLGPVAYRLRTELAIEAWHWNPEGRWSDSARQQGYWVSNDRSSAPIEVSYGYRLPRRGRTRDDGNDDGYSRIDDGDPASYWKSNPYLDPRYTGESEAAHPQWLVVDLGAAHPVNAARVAWGAPWPRRYRFEYWDGDQSLWIDRNPHGSWRPFPAGSIENGQGGEPTLSLAPRPVVTRFVRVTLWESSHAAVAGSTDPRDSLGFALREIALGTLDESGKLADVVRHGTNAARQSWVLVSSTDPWHRARDRDPRVMQPGFDLVFRSGLTHQQPVLLPVGVLYDTPENAAALLRFLRARGYPVERLELGEEPDGQRVAVEDYAALYLQFARALHGVDPTVTLGGPSWQSARNDVLAVWPDRPRSGVRPGWVGRFLDYLESHGGQREFGFFSFEWYPFDDPCAATAPQLAAAPALLAAALGELREEGLLDSIPRIMTEYGYSPYSGPAEVEITSALLNAEAVGGFFSRGGSQAYVYGLEPGRILREPGCSRWGNNLLFLADTTGQARYRMPAYHAARLLTSAWADSSGGIHELYSAQVARSPGGQAEPLVSAYALRRPDQRWGVLLVNRDPRHAWSVETRIRARGSGSGRALEGPLEIWQYGTAQYRWLDDGPRGRPVRNLPPSHRVLERGTGPVILPPYSLTVVVGR